MKSILKPEDSIVAGVAVMAAVVGIYEIGVGPVSVAHATRENSPILAASRKKAGWTAVIAVAGISLLAKDPTIAILGAATIMAMELHYRHAIMVNPVTGTVTPPGPAAYQPAQNVVPLQAQGAAG